MGFWSSIYDMTHILPSPKDSMLQGLAKYLLTVKTVTSFKDSSLFDFSSNIKKVQQ